MAATWRIRDRRTFDELRRRGRRVRSGVYTVTWLPGPTEGPPRVAYAVGRACGPAVRRNRIRRRLRAVVAELAPGLPPGAYLVGAGPAAATHTFDEMRATVSTAFAMLEGAPARPAPR